MDPATIIEVPVAALLAHEGVYEAHSYIHQAGLPITEQHVEAVFRHYGIGKKILRHGSESGLHNIT